MGSAAEDGDFFLLSALFCPSVKEPLGQKPGLQGAGVMSLLFGNIFSIRPISVQPTRSSRPYLRQQLPNSLNAANQTTAQKKEKIRQVKRWAESAVASSRWLRAMHLRCFVPRRAPCQVSAFHGRNESRQIAHRASAAGKHQLLRYKGKALLAPAPAV